MKLGELMQALIELEADMSFEVVIGFGNTIGCGTVDSADVFDGKLFLTCEEDAKIFVPPTINPAESGGKDGE